MKKLVSQKNIEKLILISFIILGITVLFLLENKVNFYKNLKSKSASEIGTRPTGLINKKSDERLKIERIKISINDNEFNPKVLRVTSGSKVIVNIKVIEGYHNLYIHGYEIKSRNIPTNKIGQLIFIATRSGSFKITSDTGKYKNEPEGLLVVE